MLFDMRFPGARAGIHMKSIRKILLFALFVPSLLWLLPTPGRGLLGLVSMIRRDDWFEPVGRPARPERRAGPLLLKKRDTIVKAQCSGRKANLCCTALLVAGFLLTSVATAFASLVSIDIQNGSFPGTIGGSPVTYSYSVIHDASVAIGTYAGGTYYDGGVDLFSPINGSLSGDLSSSAGTLTLSGITGGLSSNLTSGGAARFGGSVGSIETFTITGGSLSSTSGGPASGFISYTLTGALNTSGTFYFAPVKFLDGTPSPNSLSNTWLYLWGDNWVINGNNRPTDGSALGLDLTGKITPVPLPAAAWLFGSGLGSVAFARFRQLRSMRLGCGTANQ